MASPLLHLRSISLTFGGTPLLQEAELNASAGQRVGLVGRNGSGKSTLLKIAAGLTDLDAGVRFVQPGATLRYLPQEPDLAGHATVSSYAEGGLGPNDDPHQARYLLEQLGLAGDDDPALLSGGQRRRAALARILAPAPDILLLDEPTNHLDLPTIEWLESELLRMRSAIVIISHDRRFLERMTRSTVWLDRGRTRRIDVGFSEFEGWRDAALAEERREQHKLDRKIADEEHWLRYGVTARRKRNERRVAELQSLRRKRREYEDTAGSAVMAAEDGDRSGSLVVEARNIGKQYDDRPLVKNFSLRIMRGDRIGIVGPNGAGKTTLIGMLIGATAPDTGDVRLGSNLQAALLDQARDSLDPDATLIDALTGGRGEQAYVGGKHIMSYLRDFLFTPEQARTPLRALSGGERARIMLARALSAASNLLVLDEPTNDLDLETLDVLQEMIAAYSGTVIIISHDRDFLDRTVNAIVAPDGGGKWLVYAGGYSDMLAQRGADVPARLEAAGRRSIQRTTVAPSARLARRRLSFHEMHALATLPGQMEAMQANIVQLRMRLDAPDLYQRDRTGFAATAAELAAAQSQLAAAEERWLELEILREEIDGS